MKKSKVTLSIDSTVWKLAKEKIPNISQLVEDTLRINLDSKDTDEFRLRTQIKAEKENLERSERQIELLEGQLKVMRELKYSDKKANDRAWRDIWDNYRNYGTYTDESLDNAVKTLNKTKEELIQLLEYIKSMGRHIDGIKSQEWDYILQFEEEL